MTEFVVSFWAENYAKYSTLCLQYLSLKITLGGWDPWWDLFNSHFKKYFLTKVVWFTLKRWKLLSPIPVPKIAIDKSMPLIIINLRTYSFILDLGQIPYTQYCPCSKILYNHSVQSAAMQSLDVNRKEAGKIWHRKPSPSSDDGWVAFSWGPQSLSVCWGGGRGDWGPNQSLFIYRIYSNKRPYPNKHPPPKILLLKIV